jgi:hypothetical protein
MAYTLLFEYDIIAVAMLAVFFKGLHVTQLLEPAFGGTVVHAAHHPALFLVVEHGVVAGFFRVDHIPVLPAAPELTVFGDETVQGRIARLEQGIPKIIHSLAAASLIDEFEKLAVGGNKLCAGNHSAKPLS